MRPVRQQAGVRRGFTIEQLAERACAVPLGQGLKREATAMPTSMAMTKAIAEPLPHTVTAGAATADACPDADEQACDDHQAERTHRGTDGGWSRDRSDHA